MNMGFDFQKPSTLCIDTCNSIAYQCEKCDGVKTISTMCLYIMVGVNNMLSITYV